MPLKMITEIGFLEPNLKITKLVHVHDSDEEFSDSTDSEEAITETDIIIYAISNSEDLSYIQFYIKNDTDFYIHHDIITTDTITTSFYSNKKIYTAGFINTINSYNVFDFNPIAPVDIFGGHTDVINKIKLDNDLYSCSDDKTIRKYNFSTGELIETKSYDYEVKDFFLNDGAMITIDETNIYTDQKFYTNRSEITCSQLNDDLLYFGDIEGTMKIFDTKNKTIVKEIKLSDDEINAFDFYGDTVYILSGTKLIILNSDETTKEQTYENELMSIAIDSDLKLCVIGDIKDEVIFVDLP